jgi:uncharacterized protein
MSILRRRFLEAAAAVPLAAQAASTDAGHNKGIPMRVFGRTGRKITILVFGGGSRYLMYKEEAQAIEALNLALELGINYIDTAASYGNGESEKRVGKVLKGRRDQVFLTTKLSERAYDGAMRQFERSLANLGTDHVNLVHIHALAADDDLAAIEAKDGVLKALYALREQQAARAIGITCHAHPDTLRKALERHDFDCTQMALNAARAGSVNGQGGMVMTPPMENSFETLALPVAIRKGLGVIAMKVFAQEGLVGAASPAELLSYSWSLPVSACVVGMPQLRFIRENVELAKAFQPMAPAEMKRLSGDLAAKKKASLDRFFADHMDA